MSLRVLRITQMVVSLLVVIVCSLFFLECIGVISLGFVSAMSWPYWVVIGGGAVGLLAIDQFTSSMLRDVGIHNMQKKQEKLEDDLQQLLPHMNTNFANFVAAVKAHLRTTSS